jgi:2-C-methyl-D-erythritol 4-phosphate cytidylyltransferase
MTIALIVAAGRGERLRAGRPKALVELAGRPLLQWSIEALSGADGVDRIIVALPAGAEPPPGVIAVEGGAVRSDSVRRALGAAGPGDPADAVIVHDAARPLVTAELANRVLSVLMSDEGLDAAIAATPLSDTVKRVQAAPLKAGGEKERAPQGAGVVIETLERSGLWAVQTPQIFRRAALERALDVPGEVLAQATDDAWLMERLGGRVAVVAGPAENLKVTTELDLELAELLLTRREQP